MKIVFMALQVLWAFAVSGFAMDKESALKIFKERVSYLDKNEANREIIKEAREFFVDLAAKSSGDDKLKAASYALKLYIFEGDYLYEKEGVDKKARYRLFSQCLDWIDFLSPERIGRKTQVYYMGVNACRAWKVEVGGVPDALSLPKYFGGAMDTLYRGLELGGEYLGGGLYRSGAAVMVNPGTKIIGLYKPEEALKFMQAALAAGKDPLDENSHLGEDYCENYLYKIKALIELKNMAAASETLDEAVFWFGLDLLSDPVKVELAPLGLEAESLVCARRLKDLVRKTDGLSL